MLGRVNTYGGGSLKGMPEFTYTGQYSLIDDGDDNWRIKFLSSGTLNFTRLGTGNGSIDVFCVGGGAGYVRGNAWDDYGYYYPKCYGGGGYTKTTMTTIAKKTDISVVVGNGSSNGPQAGSVAAGGSSSFGTISANGGAAHSSGKGGDGGSGGAGFEANRTNFNGGTDGANGGGTYPGSGQGTTTREFGEATGDLYAAGGGVNLTTATPNSGNGGTDTIPAQDGIVIIRNHR